MHHYPEELNIAQLELFDRIAKMDINNSEKFLNIPWLLYGEHFTCSTQGDDWTGTNPVAEEED